MFLEMKMCGSVTVDTEGHEIFGDIIAKLTARLDVMDLEFLSRPTGLAVPAIPL